ncbi:MAG TPA: response regulator [Alphaproteobacteria bacterium]|nr:response regulator [Alphaproteobacteria bacterium]
MSMRGARVLIADDEEAVRAFVARALTHHGYEVETAEDGLAALEALARQRYDLLVTDIVMPGLDGIELALKVSKDYPETIILMMTGYAAEKQRAYGLESLIHQVISKPFSLTEICDTVKGALAERGRV